jgi:transposase
LRWRIVWQSEALGISCSEIATNLSIDISTVKRVLQIFATTGDVCKKPYPSERAYRKINEPVQHYILYLTLTRPGIYLREIVSEVSTVLGLDITESAVCKFLKRIGFTHHKLATYALQRDDTLRQQFVLDVSLHNRDTLLFVDETGTDRKDAIRKYGYSLRGKPLKAQKLLVRGEHISFFSISLYHSA